MCTHLWQAGLGRMFGQETSGSLGGHVSVLADGTGPRGGGGPSRAWTSAGLWRQGQCDQEPPSSPRACAEDKCVLPGVWGAFSVLLEGTAVEQGTPPLTLMPPAPLAVAPAHCPFSGLLSSPAWRLRRPPTSPSGCSLGRAASAPRFPTHEMGGKELHAALWATGGQTRSPAFWVRVRVVGGRGARGCRWALGSPEPRVPAPPCPSPAPSAFTPHRHTLISVRPGGGPRRPRPLRRRARFRGHAGHLPSAGPGVSKVPAVHPAVTGGRVPMSREVPCPGRRRLARRARPGLLGRRRGRRRDRRRGRREARGRRRV